MPISSGPAVRASGIRSWMRREDLDPLDRIDAEIGVEPHVELEHLDGIARLVGDRLEQDPRSALQKLADRVRPGGLRRWRTGIGAPLTFERH